MNGKSRLMLVVSIAVLLSIFMSFTVAASPAAPGNPFIGPVRPDDTLVANPAAGPHGRVATPKPIDQPNVKDYQRNQERMRLLAEGKDAEAAALAMTVDDRVLVILVEFAGTDTFTWSPGVEWDPLGKADPPRSCTMGTATSSSATARLSSPRRSRSPTPARCTTASSGRSRPTTARATPSGRQTSRRLLQRPHPRQRRRVRLHARRTARRVRGLPRQVGQATTTRTCPAATTTSTGDVVGWVQVPHSVWWYGADQCPGARSADASGRDQTARSPAPAAPRRW